MPPPGPERFFTTLLLQACYACCKNCNLKMCIFELMLTKNEILNKLSDLKPILRREYSVSRIGLFGSFSDESDTEESDIDLLVEFEKPIGWKYFSLEIYLENIFGRKIDLVTKNALKDQLKDKILNQVKYV
jgi:predicted nucleotidyltransferase